MKTREINSVILMLGVVFLMALTSGQAVAEEKLPEQAVQPNQSAQADRQPQTETRYITAVVYENGKPKTIRKAVDSPVSSQRKEETQANQPEIPGWVKEMAEEVVTEETDKFTGHLTRTLGSSEELEGPFEYWCNQPFNPSKPGKILKLPKGKGWRRRDRVRPLGPLPQRKSTDPRDHIVMTRGPNPHPAVCICSLEFAKYYNKAIFPIDQAVYKDDKKRREELKKDGTLWLSSAACIPGNWKRISETEYLGYRKLRRIWLEKNLGQYLKERQAFLQKQQEGFEKWKKNREKQLSEEEIEKTSRALIKNLVRALEKKDVDVDEAISSIESSRLEFLKEGLRNQRRQRLKKIKKKLVDLARRQEEIEEAINRLKQQKKEKAVLSLTN